MMAKRHKRAGHHSHGRPQHVAVRATSYNTFLDAMKLRQWYSIVLNYTV